MKTYFGWARNSDMPSVYIHLSQKDVNSKYKSVVIGSKVELEPKPSILLPKACPWCGENNEPTVRYCPRCGCRLGDEQEIKSISEEMKLLEIFKTSFGRQIITDYNHLKTQNSLLQRFYQCFNGIHVRKIVEIRQHFSNLTDDQLLEFLGILSGLDLIDIVGNRIFLSSRERFLDEIEGSKKLISINNV